MDNGEVFVFIEAGAVFSCQEEVPDPSHSQVNGTKTSLCILSKLDQVQGI